MRPKTDDAGTAEIFGYRHLTAAAIVIPGIPRMKFDLYVIKFLICIFYQKISLFLIFDTHIRDMYTYCKKMPDMMRCTERIRAQKKHSRTSWRSKGMLMFHRRYPA